MSITNSSSARRAGFKVNNASIKKAAAIAMAKMGTRTLRVALPCQAWHLANNASFEAKEIFTVISMSDAGVDDIYVSFRLPAEYDSGDLTVVILWSSVSVTGAAKFSVDFASKAASATTASENTQTVTTTVSATANKINESAVVFASSLITAGDLVGIHINRTPADAADTLGAEATISGIFVEFTGRG